MEKKEKAPVLRFKDTNGKDYPAWEQRELKDVAEIVGGGTPSTSVPAYWNGSIDWYSPTEIGQENFAKGSKRKISNEGLNNSSAKLLPAHKTILFTSRATIGEAAILEREGATNQGFQSIVTKEGVDVYFLYSYKHHLKKQALIKASGSTFLEISKNEVEGLHVPVPSGEEQAKIGSFFKLVDKAITLHQRKLEALKKLKRTLLQKMFPKKGHLKPELRFFGFTNDWEQRKFQEITQRVSTSSISSIDFPSVEYEDIEAGSGTLNKDVKLKEKNKKGTVFNKNDILFGKLRPYLMNWLLADFKGVAVGDFWVLRSQNCDPKFVYSLIHSKSFQEVANRSSGSKMPRADWNLVSNTLFFVPSQNNEQRKIGELFSSLDKVITLHQRKLEIYKKLKKGLLQKMFI